MDSEEVSEKRKAKFKENINKDTPYEKRVNCPACKARMTYIYGETYECPNCGCRTLTDFGKVRKYLEDNGPRTAIVISEATGVSIEVINRFLREGRIEIPDGSEQYIKCLKCGAEIRYGRYCPECMKKLSGSISKAMWTPDVGEKPKKKYADGKMHFLSENNMHHK